MVRVSDAMTSPFKPYLQWNGKIENYAQWKQKMLDELKTINFENEDKKVFFVKQNIVGKQKSQIKEYLLDCSSAGELFQCLDAHNSSIYPALQRLLEKLKKLQSLPQEESEENQNIQQIIHYLRIIRKNKMELPFDFASLYANKLSSENCKRIINMKNENLDLDDIEVLSKVLYEMQATNVQMIASLENKVPGVTAKKKTSLVAPMRQNTHLKKKTMVESKLSRIRKRFYLTRDADIAMVYRKEVERYLSHFTMTKDEYSRWKSKIDQTVLKIPARQSAAGTSIKPEMFSGESADAVPVGACCEEEVPVMHKDTLPCVEETENDHATTPEECSIDVEEEENNDEKMIYLPYETSNDNKEKIKHNESTSPTQSETAELCAPPTVSERCEIISTKEVIPNETNVVENPKNEKNNHATSTEECGIDAVVKEDSNENNPQVEDEDDELTLPDVPDEVPGGIEHDDQDEILHVRLRKLKKFRQKHFRVKNYEEETVVLKEANYMPNQCTGAKKIQLYPPHRQCEPECNPALISIDLQTSGQEN